MRTRRTVGRTRASTTLGFHDRSESSRTAILGGEPTEFSVIHEERPTSVRYYPASEPDGAPIFLVYALFNRPAILDLGPDRSVIRALLDGGHDVYLVDWGRPSGLDATLDLTDYIDRYLANALSAVVEHAGAQPHLLGYSTGGTLAAVGAAMSPDTIRTLALLGAPIGFEGIRGGLYGMIGASPAPEAAVESSSTVDGDLLALAFSMAAPFEYHYGRYLRLAEESANPAAFANRLRRFAWGTDTIDVPAAVLGDLVDTFRRDAIVSGSLMIGDRPVDLGRIDVPVAALIGSDDRFVPPESTRRALDLVASTDTTVFQSPTGHVGLAAEAVSYRDLWPAYLDWIHSR